MRVEGCEIRFESSGFTAHGFWFRVSCPPRPVVCERYSRKQQNCRGERGRSIDADGEQEDENNTSEETRDQARKAKNKKAAEEEDGGAEPRFWSCSDFAFAQLLSRLSECRSAKDAPQVDVTRGFRDQGFRVEG